MKEAVRDEDNMEKIAKLFAELETDDLAVPRSQTIFDDLEGMLKQGIRFPSGISWFDYLMNGGGAAGEMVCIIAPSGGGKSTLAHQFVNEQVEQQEHCPYISAEQELEGDFALRQAVLSTKSTRDDWDNKEWHEVDEKLRTQLEKMRPLHEEYFHFYDFVNTEILSMRTLMEPVYRLKAEGKCPKYVIIDWWGVVRDSFIASKGLNMGSDQKRTLQRLLLKRLSGMAKELGVVLIIFQQLSGQAASKGSKARQSSHDAQEDKNFNNYFDFAITIGKKDEKDMVRLMADKARRCANTEVWLKLDGGACRFINADNPDESAAAYERGAATRSDAPYSTSGADASNMWSSENMS